MLRELIEAWKGEDLQSRMLEEFDEMLDAAHWIFERACEALLGEETQGDVQEEIARRDQRIKELEAKIRKQIIEHLTIRPGKDVTGCLIMMSVVKDAERIGDYARNLFDLRKLYSRKFKHGRYLEPVLGVRQAISGVFSKVRQAFRTGDTELAKAVVATETETGAKCDGIIERLFQDEEIKTDRAIAYTLLARFLNRTGAHLANIATTVLRPAHLIDLPVTDTETAEGAHSDEPRDAS